MAVAAWFPTMRRSTSSSSSKAFGVRLSTARTPTRRSLTVRGRASWLCASGRPGIGGRGLAGADLARGFHPRAHALQVAHAGADVPDPHHLPALADDADDALPQPHLGPGALLGVAAGRRDAQDVAGQVLEEDHRVREAQDAVHRPEDDPEDLVEVQRGGDLGGDLLDDPDVVGLLGEVAVQTVDRLLILGDLLPERGRIARVGGHCRTRGVSGAGESPPAGCARRRPSSRPSPGRRRPPAA